MRNKGLEKFGIINVDKAMTETDNVYLIMAAITTKIEGHFEENFGVIIRNKFEIIPIDGAQMQVFQIRSKGKEL